MKKLAVFVSGTGSILEAILQDGIPIELVLADRECRGFKIAKAAGIPTELVERTFKSFDREGYTRKILEILLNHEIDLVAMAGFMTILAPFLFEEWPGIILNTHPSLLPAFKGDNAVRDALNHGVKVTGCTIHRATAKLDEGPILAQTSVPVLPGDTRETLHERIKKEERALYPRVIKQMLEP